MPLWLANLIAKYGIPAVAAVGLVLVLILGVSLKIGWQKVVIWYQAGKIERVEAQRDYARAEAKVAQKDRAQVESSAQITQATRTNTDAWLAWQRTQAQTGTEVIRERIREVPVPVACVQPADPVVLRVVAEARARAEAAAGELRGTPTR